MGAEVHPALHASRPRPQPTDLTRPFWAAARERTLVRPVCEWGHDFFPPQVACPLCLCERWRWVPSSGRGAVYSWTTIHRAPAPGFDLPYVLAIIDLEEGWSMLANVVNCPPGSMAVDLRVSVTWLTAEDGFVLPAFEPVEVGQAR
jgi:uncharacterized OB-fold protein